MATFDSSLMSLVQPLHEPGIPRLTGILEVWGQTGRKFTTRNLRVVLKKRHWGGGAVLRATILKLATAWEPWETESYPEARSKRPEPPGNEFQTPQTEQEKRELGWGGEPGPQPAPPTQTG